MPKPSHHNETPSADQALIQQLTDEWHQTLLPLLPKEWEAQGKQLKAFVRANGLHSAADLLRGILAYTFCFSSFRQVGCWANSIGISTNGERSWAKRSRQARQWLLWMMQLLLLSPLSAADHDLAAPTARVYLVDASNVRGWRKSGAQSRLHVSYDLQARQIAQVVLSDQHMGERLTTFTFAKGDLLVADRGYCRRQALSEVLAAGGQIVVRLHWGNVPLQHQDGSGVDVCRWVNSLAEGSGELAVWMTVNHQRIALRLLAKRLSPEAASRAHRRRQRQASTHGHKQLHPWSLVLTDWLLVLTSLSAPTWSASQVLELYRARWQIELLFKRIKQLVRIHRLRSFQQESNEATLAALLVGWALIERQAAHLREQLALLSPDADQVTESRPTRRMSTWELDAVVMQSWRTMLLGCWTWQQIHQKLEQIARLLISHPQARLQQESTILEHLEQILAIVPA